MVTIETVKGIENKVIRTREKFPKETRVSKKSKNKSSVKVITPKLGKILKKPSAKGISPVSAEKIISRIAQEQGPLVREVEPREIVQDNRSLFFKSEFNEEKRGINKWLA